MTRSTRNAPVLFVLAFGLATGYLLASDTPAADPLDFSDPRALTPRLMAFYDEIQLTPAQEAVKKEALEAIPAACCADNTAYTCCCPCNLSRTVWGLSAYLITERGADAERVRSEVQRWYGAVNEDEFPGDSCYTGGCGKPFAEGGCGGMRPNQVVWGS